MHTPIRSIWVLLAAGLFCISAASAQVGIGTSTPDPNSILQVFSGSKGVLLPRLSGAQQTALSSVLGTGETGMLVTDATTGKLIAWQGTSFTDVTNLAAQAPLNVSATNQVSINPGTAVGDLITWDGNNWVNMQPATQHFTFVEDNHQPYLTMNYCIALFGIFPARNDGADPFVSQICLFPFDFTPLNWAQCNGQILPIASNTALFSLLGTQFGGNGTTNFALPDLRSRIPIDFGQGAGLTQYSVGDQGGIESSTISR